MLQQPRFNFSDTAPQSDVNIGVNECNNGNKNNVCLIYKLSNVLNVKGDSVECPE